MSQNFFSRVGSLSQGVARLLNPHCSTLGFQFRTRIALIHVVTRVVTPTLTKPLEGVDLQLVERKICCREDKCIALP